MPSHRSSGAGRRLLMHLPNWLGDAVMATPALDHLAGLEDGPEIHLAVRDAWLPLFAADDRLAGRLVLDRRARHGGAAGVLALAADIRALGVDGVVVGPPSFGAAVAAALGGAGTRAGLRGDGRGFLLKPAVRRGARGSRHYALEMLDAVAALCEAWGLPAPEREPVELPRASLPGCAAIKAAARGAGRGVWVVAPGTTYGEAKTWPVERVADLVEAAVREHGVRIVLLGDAGAAGFVAGLQEATDLDWSAAGDVIDLVGRTNLAEVVSELKGTDAFVGNDSGLMHLAAALDVPTVGVFGSSNPDWTRPLGRRTAAVTAAGFACRPCYRRTCNQPEFCLATVPAEMVLERMTDLLGRDRA